MIYIYTYGHTCTLYPEMDMFSIHMHSAFLSWQQELYIAFRPISSVQNGRRNLRIAFGFALAFWHGLWLSRNESAGFTLVDALQGTPLSGLNVKEDSLSGENMNPGQRKLVTVLPLFGRLPFFGLTASHFWRSSPSCGAGFLCFGQTKIDSPDPAALGGHH